MGDADQPLGSVPDAEEVAEMASEVSHLVALPAGELVTLSTTEGTHMVDSRSDEDASRSIHDDDPEQPLSANRLVVSAIAALGSSATSTPTGAVGIPPLPPLPKDMQRVAADSCSQVGEAASGESRTEAEVAPRVTPKSFTLEDGPRDSGWGTSNPPAVVAKAPTDTSATDAVELGVTEPASAAVEPAPQASRSAEDMQQKSAQPTVPDTSHLATHTMELRAGSEASHALPTTNTHEAPEEREACDVQARETPAVEQYQMYVVQGRETPVFEQQGILAGELAPTAAQHRGASVTTRETPVFDQHEISAEERVPVADEHRAPSLKARETLVGPQRDFTVGAFEEPTAEPGEGTSRRTAASSQIEIRSDVDVERPPAAPAAPTALASSIDAHVPRTNEPIAAQGTGDDDALRGADSVGPVSLAAAGAMLGTRALGRSKPPPKPKDYISERPLPNAKNVEQSALDSERGRDLMTPTGVTSTSALDSERGRDLMTPTGVTSTSAMGAELSAPTSIRSRTGKLLVTFWAVSLLGAGALGWLAANAANEGKLSAAAAAASIEARNAREAAIAETKAAIPPLPAYFDVTQPRGVRSLSDITKSEPAQRTRLEAVALGRKWQEKRFEEFERVTKELRTNPRKLDDAKFRAQVFDFVHDRSTSRATLELLSELQAPKALDILYEVWIGSKERNDTTQLAEAFLLSKEVRTRVTGPLEIALALRERPTDCSAIQRLVERAIHEGDRRSSHQLVALSARRNCGAGDQDCVKCLTDPKDMRKAIRASATRPDPVP